MKENKYSKMVVALIIVSIISLILSIVIILLGEEMLGKTLYTIILEIDKSLIITIMIGAVIKLITNEIYKVKKNDDKMRSLGIFQIGEGKLDNKQTNIMFGGNGYLYPKELKFQFISGVNFIDKFKPKILEAIKNGCHVKCLLANPVDSVGFLTRAEELCPQSEGSYISQIKETFKKLEEIIKETKNKEYSGTLEVRFYLDEFRYNYRIGIYNKGENDAIRLWANFQPQNKDAIELSLGVHGIYDDEFIKDSICVSRKEEESIVISINDSFDKLWEKYEYTSNMYSVENTSS